MKNIFDNFIQSRGFVVLDGAMATELEARGANLNHSLWSAKLLNEDPELIKQVHYDYLVAGADVITTASYQASFEGFAKHGYTHDEAIALMQLSVQLAFEARDEFMKEFPHREKPIVAASVGPYGASLADGSEYRGNYGVSIQDLKTFHRRRMQVLIETNADVLACETIPCIDEAVALLELLTEFPGVQAWISFSCKDAVRLSSGEDFAEALKLLNQSTQVVAVGVNCTAPQYIEALVKIAAENTGKHILVYPNKGEVWDAANKCWLPASTGDTHFYNGAKSWYLAGAKIIGGCCKTTPEDIRQLQQLG
ncbi:homocysteine S-methyltransferase [Mucilaginibacter ginsenosidivorax]|uniref:S-methylmethionine:homocysteine methyltransferase n=1 Tax=Mucilaginibacter ginsenosidivorax TaxID=862126 RepID=A0A5B8W4X3_9SPHI|nr:homocysteine S-methyltransferase [Mucilaginibacter ginsenosidivorax]QEC77982.1 homocysteine S-methyltransferase [Mucilaginibacter ginsenosidivorax]